MSRAVIYERFGGPEVLDVQEVTEPHAGPGEIRVRVVAVGLNPMDPALAAMPEFAARFNISLPSGFGYDFAGVVDEVGEGASGFVVGDRVFGGVMERAAADFVVVNSPLAPREVLFYTPEGLSDDIASTLAIAGATTAAVMAAINLSSQDTVLIGGAAGGVGVFAVQVARLLGARVIGTASEGTFSFLRELGAEPVAYGPGLADRVRTLVPDGVNAAIDLFGTETIEAALELGVAPERIAAIAAGPTPPGGAHAVYGDYAEPAELLRIVAAIAAGDIAIPIAARFPLEQIREAAALQASRHVHGKIVVTI
jgi:NADPH:quinone reductase-like Zn-dependent oxidoreductase